MAINTREYVSVPPDGAGKKLTVSFVLELTYTGGVNTSTIQVGQDAVGETSSTRAVVVKHQIDSPTTGSLTVLLDEDNREANFTVGEVITLNGGSATVDLVQQFFLHTSKTQIVSGDNPYNSQRVDNRGAAYTRFAEGEMLFTAFGDLKMSDTSSLGTYINEYGDSEKSMSNVITGNASGIFNSDTGSYTLRCTTASDDSIMRGSDKYHQYHPGASQYIKLTLSVGDSGKANVVRRWGYFDENNGMFFELNETQLNVVLRKNMGAGVQETRIAQADFNGDQADGTGLSQLNIDLSKNNLYWMDMAYLGAGSVRMGVFTPNGARLILHTFENSNNTVYSYMRTGTLPVAFEQFNTGITGSTSEMNINLASVDQEQSLLQKHWLFSEDIPQDMQLSGPDYQHVFTLRSRDTFKGRDNRVIALPSSINMTSKNQAGEFSPIRVAFTMTDSDYNSSDASWVSADGSRSSLEVSREHGTIIASDEQILYRFMTSEPKHIDLREIFPYAGDNFLSKKFNNDRPGFSLYVRAVDPSDTITVNGVFNWEEYR